MSPEARVGAFLMAGLLVTAGIIFRLGDVRFRREYPLRVSFRDVSGMPDKSAVKLSGVEVGRVAGIELENDRAVVKIRIRDHIKIYKDAVFRVGSTSVIGSKFLQIDQGHSASGVIESGATVLGEDTLPLEQMIANAFKSVQGLLDGMHGTLDKDSPLMMNMTASVENMRALTANLNDMMADVKPHLEKSLERSDQIAAKLDSLLARTDELMAKLNSSSGTVGALMGDQEMKENVKKTVANMREASGSAKDVLGRINNFHIYWSVTGRNEPAASATKGDLGLKIVPRPGHYYYLGGANLGGTDNIPRGVDYEKKNSIDALIGFNNEWWDVFAGGLHSTFGFGTKLKPLWWDPLLSRITVFAQAYDFGRNRTILGRTFDKPQYDAGVDVKVQKWVSLGARVNDIATVKRYETTANVTFEDKDIAYFFGLVSFSGGAKK